MFGESEIDLQFSVFGIPVRVRPTFWLLGAFLGYRQGDAAFLGVNVLAVMFMIALVVFVSVLIHELGHAIVIEGFGWPCRITLWHIGGFAAYHPTSTDASWKRIVIALAGPFAGFLLAALALAIGVFGSLYDWFPENGIVEYLLNATVLVNVLWGILNLMPVLPLDGGHVCEHTLGVMGVRTNREWAHKVSIVVAGAIAAFFLTGGQQLNGLMFLFLAVNNFQALQHRRY